MTRSRRRIGALAVATTLLGSLGCGQPVPSHIAPTNRGPATVDVAGLAGVPIPQAAAQTVARPMGHLKVVLNWPEVRSLQTQVLPDSSTDVTITVTALDLPTPIVAVATHTAGETSATAALDVPTGTNRS